jgi:hypothetical protein
MNWSEIWFLFTLGIQFAIAFRVTKNILVLWPFYTWIGGMYSNIEDGLIVPFEATYGFVIILVLMIASIMGTYIKQHSEGNAESPKPKISAEHSQNNSTNNILKAVMGYHFHKN